MIHWTYFYINDDKSLNALERGRMYRRTDPSLIPSWSWYRPQKWQKYTFDEFMESFEQFMVQKTIFPGSFTRFLFEKTMTIGSTVYAFSRTKNNLYKFEWKEDS